MFPINHSQKPTEPCISWVKNKLGTGKISIQPLPEHAHNQKNLYTITNSSTEKSYLLIETVDNTEACLKFIALAKQLKKNDILAPSIYFQQISKNRCWIITTHFGYETALDWLSKPHKADQRKQLINHCLYEIYRFQNQKIDYPVSNYNSLHRLAHMNLADEFFIQKLLKATNTEYNKEALAFIKQHINEQIEKIPTGLIHFDFHSANLMLLPKRTLGILDFQDMAIGPINYDLASLLTDHYYHHDEQEINQYIQQYYQKHLTNEQKKSLNEATFKESTMLVAVQRHLKNIGIFTRLFFNNKYHYIKHIPNMMHRLEHLCQNHHTLKYLPNILWSKKMKNLYINGITQHCTEQNCENIIDDLLTTVHTQKPKNTYIETT